ncbi:phosphatidylinositol 4-kinase, partial [Reticulomyxa filosa]
ILQWITLELNIDEELSHTTQLVPLEEVSLSVDCQDQVISPSWPPLSGTFSSNVSKTVASSSQPHHPPPSARVTYSLPKGVVSDGNLSSRAKSPVENPFGELWEDRKKRISSQSCRISPDWDLQSVIFKSGEDMRQEQFAMQNIRLFQKIFKEAKLPLQLRTYSVVVTSPASGFVETVTNACSISSLKHRVKNFSTLYKFFEQHYGPTGTSAFNKAQKNFVESMAAYSLVCYFLQVKDRHNGNILIDNEGRIIHIDFGFIMSNSPGGNFGFESAPFKLTEEFIQVMGGEKKVMRLIIFEFLLFAAF